MLPDTSLGARTRRQQMTSQRKMAPTVTRDRAAASRLADYISDAVVAYWGTAGHARSSGYLAAYPQFRHQQVSKRRIRAHFAFLVLLLLLHTWSAFLSQLVRLPRQARPPLRRSDGENGSCESNIPSQSDTDESNRLMAGNCKGVARIRSPP